jgi:hypothetical protein
MANRVSFSGHQYFCAWDSTERHYQFTVYIKRSVEEADFRGVQHMTTVPGCGGALSIWFTDFRFLAATTLTESETCFTVYLELNFNGKLRSNSEARMSVVSPNERKIKPWEKLKVVAKYAHKTQWLKRHGGCTHA